MLIHKILWKFRHDVSLKKRDTRQKAAIQYFTITPKPITVKSGLEGGWTEEIIDRYSFRSVRTLSFYSRSIKFTSI